MAWFVRRDGEQFGPFDEAALQDMIREGRVSETDLLYNSNDADAGWIPAEQAGIWQQPTPTAGDAIPPPLPGTEAGGEPPVAGVASNTVLMRRARNILRGHWGTMILYLVGFGVIQMIVWFMIAAVLGLASTFNEGFKPFEDTIGSIISHLFMLIVQFGFMYFALNFIRCRRAEFVDLFAGLQRFGRAFGLYFWQWLFIGLWMLLFIIPGLVAMFAYTMAYYIAIDYPGISTLKALEVSRRLMVGHKWRYFCLGMRFIGLAVLCLFTLGIGFLWLRPYMMVTHAAFYEDLKRRYPLGGVLEKTNAKKMPPPA